MAKPVELTHSYGERVEVLADIGGPSMTRQEFADECDVNLLMKRYDVVGGGMPPAPGSVPMYIDFTSKPDNLMDALAMMKSAETAFMTLPASVRKEFDNDPLRFVEYAENEANLPRMREWGLAEPEKAAEEPQLGSEANPIRTRPVDPKPASA